MWKFPKIGVPPNHPFIDRIFHYKPSILGYPHFRKHPFAYIYPSRAQGSPLAFMCARHCGVKRIFTATDSCDQKDHSSINYLPDRLPIVGKYVSKNIEHVVVPQKKTKNKNTVIRVTTTMMLSPMMVAISSVFVRETPVAITTKKT